MISAFWLEVVAGNSQLEAGEGEGREGQNLRFDGRKYDSVSTENIGKLSYSLRIMWMMRLTTSHLF